MNKRWLLAGLTATAAVHPALAEIKINENLAVSGYVTGSAYEYKVDGAPDVGEMEVDSTKIAVHGAFEKLTGMVSIHTFDTSDVRLLDAYATYAPGGGTTVTLGKFLSYLGFEAFDYPNMLQISYANDLGKFIPAYHSGVRLDYANESGFSAGLAVLDSVYGPNAYEGDHDLGNGAGFEGILKYTKNSTTAFLGLAYDASGPGNQLTADFWVQTVIADTTFAAEYCRSEIETPFGDADGYFWMGLAMKSFGKWSVTARVSGGEDETVGPDAKFTKFTLSPAVTLTDNLGVLFEYSRTDYRNTGSGDADFLAAQFVFKF